MDKLSVEEVKHVAYLARLELTDAEIEKFRVQLKTLLNVNHDTVLRDDVEGEMLDYKTALMNAPRTNGNFVEVPVMIGE